MASVEVKSKTKPPADIAEIKQKNFQLKQNICLSQGENNHKVQKHDQKYQMSQKTK